MRDLIKLTMIKGAGVCGVSLCVDGIEMPVEGIRLQWVCTDGSIFDLRTKDYDAILSKRETEKAAAEGTVEP